MDLTALQFKEPLSFAVTRDMTPVDVEVLATMPRGQGTPPLKRLSERHHALARLIAAGTSHSDAAIIVGLHRNRVSMLMGDTSFQELVEFYRGEVTSSYLDAQAQLAGLGLDALAELRRRLEETPEEMGANLLVELVKVTSDRTGNGPSSTSKQEVSVVNDLAARMRNAREAASRAIDLQARDITPQGAAE